MSALLPVYERDLVLVSGRRARLVDASGRSFLDFAAGIGVAGVGHCDPKVTAAIRRQAGTLMHVSNLYHTELGARLAERLVALAFPSQVFLCNSGTEANEGAIKFARRVGRAQGRHELVAFERGFAGRSLGALSLTWNPKYREPFEPLVPGARFVPWNDLAAAAEAIGARTAAVFVEPVQGEGGVRPAPVEFLRGLRRLCSERGALLVADEVQCGLARTGRMFAYQHADIVPDILTLAKPLGGGLPLGAILLAQAHCAALVAGDHGSTFGGNPVAAAAAHAVLDRLGSAGFVDGVARRGQALMRGLRGLRRRHAQIVDVRGLGLMIGVEFAGEVAPIVKGLRERGVLAVNAGPHVLRLLPPLVITAADVRTFLETLEAVLASGAGSKGWEPGTTTPSTELPQQPENPHD